MSSQRPTRAYVLGAGASKSYADSPTGQRMPIARDFFQTLDGLEISNNPWVLRDKIAWYLAENGESNAAGYLRSGIDIEDLHSRIAEDMLATIASEDPLQWAPSYGAYNELVFLFAAVINEIQNGPVSRAHVGIARTLGQGDGVITFNWDTLMDRALEQVTDWRADWGYGMTPYGIFDRGWRNVEPPPQSNDFPRLLKLHGSTSWLTAYPTRESGQYRLTHALAPELVGVVTLADQEYACYAGRCMPGYKRFSYGYYPPNLLDVPGLSAPEGHLYVRSRPKFPWIPEGTAPDGGLVSMPLIIPPVKEKDYRLFGELFTGIWSQAQDLLSEVDEIVIIGYSFPRTDLRSHALFVHAFMKRTTIPRVIIIDPAPETIADKIEMDFGIPKNHISVIKDYFSDQLDLQSI